MEKEIVHLQKQVKELRIRITRNQVNLKRMMLNEQLLGKTRRVGLIQESG